MDDRIIDIFSREAVSTTPPLPKPPKQKQPYSPYEVSNNYQSNLWLRLNRLAGILRSYSYLTDALFHSDRVELFYRNGDGVIIIWGSFLEELREPLQDRTLRSVTCFHQTDHIKPVGDKMIITSIHDFSMNSYNAAVAEVKKLGQKSNS